MFARKKSYRSFLCFLRNDLNEFCNKDCNCPDKIPFEPVCSSNSHIVYYSPCHAGCRTQDLYSRQVPYILSIRR